MHNFKSHWQTVAALCLMATSAACLGIAVREIVFGHQEHAATVALEIDPPTLRITDSAPGQAHALAFTVTNSTGEAIEIDSLSTTCGCTIASHGQSHIALGGTATVDVQWTAPVRVGVYDSKVLVRWRSDKQSGTAAVKISGKVASAEQTNDQLIPAL